MVSTVARRPREDRDVGAEAGATPQTSVTPPPSPSDLVGAREPHWQRTCVISGLSWVTAFAVDRYSNPQSSTLVHDSGVEEDREFLWVWEESAGYSREQRARVPGCVPDGSPRSDQGPGTG